MDYSQEILRRVAKYSPNIFDKTPKERDQIVYVPKFMCQASLPKKLENTNEWSRSFNNHKYTILSPSNIGVPGGTYSRLILIYINTLAKRTKSPVLNLGNTYSELMHSIGLNPSGGKYGNINTFKEHFVRCINCIVHTENRNGKEIEYLVSPIIESAKLRDVNYWKWNAEIQLSNSFFEESQTSVPTDFGALRCLMPGTLRMDIFIFLVRRLYYFTNETVVPWDQLAAMFSSPDISNKRFRQSFKQALAHAQCFYQAANVDIVPRGLRLRKSQRLIQPLK